MNLSPLLCYPLVTSGRNAIYYRVCSIHLSHCQLLVRIVLCSLDKLKEKEVDMIDLTADSSDEEDTSTNISKSVPMR